MAELLVQAKPHWMDKMTKQEIDALPEDRRRNRDARAQLGDIIVVRPDGWKWGREERLPNYVVIKIPGKTVEELNYLGEALMEDDPDKPGEKYIKRKRKYNVPQGIMQAHINANENAVVKNDVFLQQIIEKTS